MYGREGMDTFSPTKLPFGCVQADGQFRDLSSSGFINKFVFRRRKDWWAITAPKYRPVKRVKHTALSHNLMLDTGDAGDYTALNVETLYQCCVHPFC